MEWQDLSSRGATEVSPVSRFQKVPPCLMKPMPSGSKTHLMLAKAKPTSDGGGGGSGITGLRGGGCETAAQQLERGE